MSGVRVSPSVLLINTEFQIENRHNGCLFEIYNRQLEMNIKGYFADVYNELVNKVSWPSWSELQSSATIVMIASVIIALGIFVMDFVFRHVMTFVYSMFY